MGLSPVCFNRPYLTGAEFKYLEKAYRNGVLAGDGFFTRKCQRWLEKKLVTKKAFLTHSCTAALEMAAVLADIKQGDEVIMPSYTFVSTANAFVLRGGVPIFVDIRPDTLNIDEKLIEKAITRKTKAIVPVHYAGVGCEMDVILKIAKKYGLLVIEDAAHGVKATYKGQELGTIGDLGALSFHETKNIISGEGGAILINNPRFIKRAEVVWQKGTDRNRFLRGEVDKYTWRDIGSSFLPGELTAAFLSAQLDRAGSITRKRLGIWQRYHQAFAPLEASGFAKRPVIPAPVMHNGHNYFLILSSSQKQKSLIRHLNSKKIGAVFHYLPLHLSAYARRWGGRRGSCPTAEAVSECLVRLPFYTAMDRASQQRVIDAVWSFARRG